MWHRCTLQYVEVSCVYARRVEAVCMCLSMHRVKYCMYMSLSVSVYVCRRHVAIGGGGRGDECEIETSSRNNDHDVFFIRFNGKPWICFDVVHGNHPNESVRIKTNIMTV